MKKMFIILIVLGIAGFLFWKYLLPYISRSSSPSQSATPAVDKDQTIYDDALLDLEGAKETLPSR